MADFLTPEQRAQCRILLEAEPLCTCEAKHDIRIQHTLDCPATLRYWQLQQPSTTPEATNDDDQH